MKQRYYTFIIGLFFTAVFFISSCNTNKRGIVPCPAYVESEKNEIDSPKAKESDNYKVDMTTE